MNQTDFLQIGEQKGYIQILNDGKRIHYVVPDKKYRFTDPEEKVRARFYVELIEQFQYDPNLIELEVTVPRRTPSDLADIVVFQDDDKKTPFIVVECKKDGISDAEFKQAIEQVFGNCNSLGGYYAAVVAGNTRRSFDVKNFKPRERSQNIIADPPVRYGKVQEWRYLKGIPQSELSVIERGELIRVLGKCHDTLWQSGKLGPAEAYDELAKILFIKIRDEKKPKRKGEPYEFQIKTHETSESVAGRIKELYKDAKRIDPEVFSKDIEIDDNLLLSVVNHLQGINLNQTDLDVKGVAFERFLGSYFKGDMGQYFTPRELVEFMIKMVEPNNEDQILDPACGSGGFLLHAMDYIRKQASDYYDEDSREHYIYWHDFAEKRLFGIEVNDSIARVAKMNMIIHDDGHSNVISNDALISFDSLYGQHSGFGKEKFDIILTNPPFGAVIKQSELPYLQDYELGKDSLSQKTEILFLERCFDFLKWETGKLAIILPDGILTNSSLQYVRDYIERHFQILAVVSLPQIAFSHYGAGVKTSILFLRKFSEQEYEHYQEAIYQIETKNEAIYTPKIEELEDQRNAIIKKGSPAQVEVIENYRQQFISILDDIEALNQKLNKTPTKKVQNLSTFFFPEIESIPTTEFELFDLQAARVELKTRMGALNNLEKRYKETFKASADSEWESQIKEEYKEKIDRVKEEWVEKDTEEIREWVRENANYPIFMAIADHIGYDATGRKDPINDLNTICEGYQKFSENPDFFWISPDSENQIFLTYRGEIVRKRVDPHFHLSKYQEFHKRLSENSYSVVPFSSLITDLKNGVEIRTYSESGYRYLRVSDLGQYGIENHNPKYVNVEEIPDKIKLASNSFLVSRSGSLGLVSVVDDEIKETILSSHIFKISLDTEKIRPEYLEAFFRSQIGQMQFFQNNNGAIIPEISQTALKSIRIVLPPLSIQNHIVNFMRSAYTQKKQKEKEADELLASIDDYVLLELGIEMPAVEEKKCFVINAGDIGGRFDPSYMQNISHIKNLETSYSLIPLRKLLIEKPQYGANERAVDGNPETDIRYIRITDIDDYGNLLDDWKTAETIQSKYLLEENDLLFARSGSVGRAFVYKSELGKAIFAGYMIRFKLDLEKVNPSFVLYYSFTKIYKLWLQSIQRTAAQPNVNSKEFQSLEIPLPSLDVQNQIVAEVGKRLARVAELRQEADAVVEQAKERVEQILLQ